MCAEWSSFFDPEKAPRPREGPDVGESSVLKDEGAFSVSALVAEVKASLAEAFPQAVTVIGEISNFKRHSSGHLYFRLKDASAAIDATMFRSAASRLKFDVQDGLEVIAEGRVDVYETRGQLQLYVERMTPRGTGALELAFRQLCEKLRNEGLFDESVKKPIPRFPHAIGIVTSPTGAAIRDIRRTLARRWPGAQAYLLATAVQGEGAAEEIAYAVSLLDANAGKYEIDTIIVARGGGSLEDLWSFNEEIVARAIFAAQIPVISGVGHEIDVTVADMVADQRAATLTAAAELAVPDAEEISQYIQTLGRRLTRTITNTVSSARSAMDAVLRSAVFRDPLARLRTLIQRVDELSARLDSVMHRQVARNRSRLEPLSDRLTKQHPARLQQRAAAELADIRYRLAWALGRRIKHGADTLAASSARLLAARPRHRLKLARHRTDALARQLESMSYRCVLARGFSITRTQKGDILRSAESVSKDDIVRTELIDGKFNSRVTGNGNNTETNNKPPQNLKKAKSPQSPTLFNSEQ